MKTQSEIQKENVVVLLNLIKENPDLPIVPIVESDVIASDDYSSWQGSFGQSEIDYTWNDGERINLYSQDFEELVQKVIDDIDPDVDDAIAEKTANDTVEDYSWDKVIAVQIGLP